MDTLDSGLTVIHHEERDSSVFSPYVPGIKVVHGALVFLSGVTAAPVYHDHPHVPEVFNGIPQDIEGQVALTFEHVDRGLRAAGCRRDQVVALFRFFTDIDADQDVVNRVQAEYFGEHHPTHTSVEVTRLAPDRRLRLELQVIAVASGPEGMG